MLPTILSRCQRFDLRRIPSALIVAHLSHIAAQEQVRIEAPALHAIARGADGGMRDAESTLDQLISFCDGQVREEDVLSMFGLASQGQVISLAGAVLQGDAAAALREVQSLVAGGKDLGRLVGDLLAHFRNLLVYQVARGDLSLLELSEEETQALARQSPLADGAALTRVLEALTECELRLRDAMSKKTLVELSLMKAIEAARAVSLDTVLDRLNQLRAPGATVSPSQPSTPVPAFKAAGATVPTAAASTTVMAVIATASGGEGPDSPNGWRSLLAAASVLQPFAKSFLAEAHPVSWDGKCLTIGFSSQFADAKDLADNPQFHQTLRKALAQLGHANAISRLVIAERPAGWVGGIAAPSSAPAAAKAAPTVAPIAAPSSAPRAAQAAKDFKDDPLIRQALEVFKGQIVDVKATS